MTSVESPFGSIALGRDTRFCMSISGRPSDFGIRFHNFLYQELGLSFLYKSFGAASVADFERGIQAMRALGIRGCGVSMPYKERAFAMADTHSPEARAIGAINTLIQSEGTLTGYNTDYLAIRTLLASRLGSSMSLKPVLLLGSGGMARAFGHALKDKGFRNTVIASRNSQTGRSLAQNLGFSFLAMDQIGQTPFSVLINATPIGMAPEHGAEHPLAFSDQALRAADVVIDSVAFPKETRLAQVSRDFGKNVISGFEISVLQAVEQFTLYTGVRPSEDATRRAAIFASQT